MLHALALSLYNIKKQIGPKKICRPKTETVSTLHLRPKTEKISVLEAL